MIRRGRWLRLVALGGLVATSLAMGTARAATSADKEGLLALGSSAPDFHLPDVVSGKIVSRDDFIGKKALLVIFICRHCPYVTQMKQGLVQLAKDYATKGLAVVAISANDPTGVPEDAPDRLKAMALEEHFTFPYLYDESQGTAKAYTAICTPDPFLFDRHRRLVYRGQFDDSRPGSVTPVTGNDLRAAIDAALADQPVSATQAPSVGCSIKWQPGHEPAYAR